MVIEALKAQLNKGNEPRLFFYRDSHGNEVDLVIPRGRQLKPIEIKSSQTWHNSFLKGIRHFHKVFADRAEIGTIVYGGARSRTTDGYLLKGYTKIGEI